jgi:hypothetical protein
MRRDRDFVAQDFARKIERGLGEELRLGLAGRCDERFLFGPAARADLCAALRRLTPGAVERVVTLADRTMSGEVELFGTRIRVVPGEIDWQADPRARRRAWTSASLTEADAIRSEDADVKYVWEVNRQQYVTWLGRAFWLTGDVRYVDRAVALIDDWIRANPFGCGVNWSSHLEVSVRTISWLWTLPFVVSWPGVEASFLRRWLESFAEHYCHLRRNLSIYTDPTNHLIGEAAGLWMLATTFPELPDAAFERGRTLGVLTREIERQFTEDGVNREQASSYHRFALDFYIQVIALSRRLAEPTAAPLAQRVGAALVFAAHLSGETGESPMIGDSDDARGLPLPELVGWSFDDVLSIGAALLPEASAHDRCAVEATAWLLGPDSIGGARASGGASSLRSRLFSQGGYSFFHASGQGGKVDVLVDVGPLGLWPNASHGHADALSINLRAGGRWILADPGTGTYFGSPRVRNSLRSTRSHNTVTIDGLDQVDMLDVFKWVNPVPVEVLAWFSEDQFDYVAARHRGYERLRRPVTHTRHVLFVRPSQVLVVDCLDGQGHHEVSSNFHFPPGLDVTPSGPCVVNVRDGETGAQLVFTFVHAGPTRHEIGESPWSSTYGQWRSAPRLSFYTTGSPPMVLCTCIEIQAASGVIPASAAETVSTDPIDGGRGLRWLRRRPDGRWETLLINPGLVPTSDSEAPSTAVLAYREADETGADLRSFRASAEGDRAQFVCSQQSRRGRS